jgi:hypothetical protein
MWVFNRFGLPAVVGFLIGFAYNQLAKKNNPLGLGLAGAFVLGVLSAFIGM